MAVICKKSTVCNVKAERRPTMQKYCFYCLIACEGGFNLWPKVSVKGKILPSREEGFDSLL